MERETEGGSAFGAYVSPKVIRRLLEEPGTGPADPQVRHFQFVLTLADDTNPQALPETLRTIVNALMRHRSTITSIEVSLVVALLGVPFETGNSPGARRELVDALLREHGERIRIAHGECYGLVGNLGSEGRYHYGGLIPGFSSILKTLIETKLGTAVEIP